MRLVLRIVCHAAMVLGIAASALGAKKKGAKRTEFFIYDVPKRTIQATMLSGAELYDPGIAATDDGLWVTWLNFIPGKGDEIHVALRGESAWTVKKTVSESPGRYARPTLTVDAAGGIWLSYESFNSKERQWDVYVRRHAGGGKFSRPQRVTPGKSNDINHCVAPDPKKGLWFVWQGDRDGQFDILARRVADKQTEAAVEEIATTPWGEWHASVSAGPKGKVYVAWDAYDGRTYNVLYRRRAEGKWGKLAAVATGPAFQGRPQVAANRDGQAWILWERGAENWGKGHRGMPHENPRLSDSYGPLHRFRELHVGLIGRSGVVHRLRTALPMPSFARAAKRVNSRKNSVKIGVSYERGVLAVDRHDRPWVVYRHYYIPQASVRKGMRSHVEKGWQLFARCLETDRWSKLYAFDVRQRDGMQRLSIVPTSRGLAAVWATGRTDRRKDTQPRGVALGVLTHGKGERPKPKLTPAKTSAVTPMKRPPAAKPATVGGKTYRLFYGDLHRHTDLSLCFPFFDGSINDAYRYAMDVAGLDFLGITDHTRDINHGNALAQLWWRCVKEATRHRLGRRFFAMFTYERSMAGTDHNVISLRDDVLRDFTYPLTEFWKELDRDTFTIPHAPVNAKTWNYQNDALRPLIEIYQGCRDYDSRKQAHVGLNKGYRVGFIASSDHVSTSASFACVWAPKAELESIFRAMQARRTFGATDRIRLIFRSGDHWMGERFTAALAPEFQIEIDGTAAIETLGVCVDGKPDSIIPVDKGAKSVRTTWPGGGRLTGKHYVYIYMKQVDGNQAWSSPIWVDVAAPKK